MQEAVAFIVVQFMTWLVLLYRLSAPSYLLELRSLFISSFILSSETWAI